METLVCLLILVLAVILSPFPLPIPSPTTLGTTSPVSSFPVEDHLVGTPTLNHNGCVTKRTVAKPMIGARQRRLCLSSCSPLPAPCSAKTSYPASHPHNTTFLHATTPHSHLPLYSHPPTPTPSNTSFFFLAKLLTLVYAFASS